MKNMTMFEIKKLYREGKEKIALANKILDEVSARHEERRKNKAA